MFFPDDIFIYSQLVTPVQMRYIASLTTSIDVLTFYPGAVSASFLSQTQQTIIRSN
jgi:hypothetical protein